MKTKLKILHLEDTPADAELVERELIKGRIRFDKLVVDNKKAFEKALNEFAPDIIIADHTLPSFDSLEAINIIKQKAIRIPFILVSSTVSDEYAVEIMKAGADDYIFKDRLHRLPQAVVNAVEKNSAVANLQTIFENTSEGFILIDSYSIVKAFNTKIAQTILLNTEKEIKIGSNIYDFIHPSRQEIFKIIQLKVMSGEPVQYDNYYLRKNGDTKWFSFTINPVVNKVGITEGICITSADITARKKAEKEIIDYKYALNQSSIVAITDQKGVIKFVNENFCNISKYSAQELIGQDHRIINSGYHPKSFIKNLWTTIANGKIWKGELKNKAKDGSIYWVDTSIIPFMDEKGKPYQYMAIRSDITERKSAEHLLYESEIFNKGVLSSLGSHIAVIDQYGNVEAVNKAWTDFGNENGILSLNSISIGSNYFDVCKQSIKNGDSDAAMALAGIQSVFNEGKENFEMEYPCHSPEEKRWFLLTVRNFGNDKYKIVISHQNITQQKLEQLQKEKISVDLIQRNHDLEQFSFIVSHNLRSPVANIIGLSENLKVESITPVVQKELLKGLSTSVTALDTVIKDINNILQVKSEVNENKEVIIFSKLVKDIMISISSLIDKHEVSIITDFSEVDEIYSLKIYIYSIFYNLIGNSIKYGKLNEPPIIEIKSKKENGKIMLTFKDNGLGIDMKKNGAKIFGLYRRFHSHVEGKGMGLFMVKTQVELLGGKISISSELNKATEFSIEFEN